MSPTWTPSSSGARSTSATASCSPTWTARAGWSRSPTATWPRRHRRRRRPRSPRSRERPGADHVADLGTAPLLPRSSEEMTATMPLRHSVVRASEARYETPANLTGHSTGFTRWSAVDDTTPGAVHTGFAICRLDAGGRVATCVASYEQSVYGVEGEVVLQTSEGATLIRPGDYGLIPVGVPHSWRNVGGAPARWAQMIAPQPRPRFDGDLVRTPDLPETQPVPVDAR